MASISRTNAGAVRVRFRLDRSTREIYLGKVSKKEAESFRSHIEALTIAQNTGTQVRESTLQWAIDLPNKLKLKLETLGLISLTASPEEHQLGPFVDAWCDGRTDVKESSRLVYRRARKWLVEFFGEDHSISEITPGDAEDWKRFLLKTLGENTARKMSGVAKQVLAYAVKKRLLSANPFDDLPTAVGARDKAFVTVETIQKLIDVAPCAEWRLILVLARYGGLRVPSEILELRWGDINANWTRITLRQPKVEHHPGKARRQMPLFPELRPYLEDLLNAKQSVRPDDYVLLENRLTNFIPQVERIARRAGVNLGTAFFTSCRSSRETELMDSNPAHVVHAWIGNSEAVAKKHYLLVTSDHFDRALTPILTPDNTGQYRTGGDITRQQNVTRHKKTRRSAVYQ